MKTKNPASGVPVRGSYPKEVVSPLVLEQPTFQTSLMALAGSPAEVACNSGPIQ